MKDYIEAKLLLIWYWLEIKYIQIFNITYPKDPIPEGMYCYENDFEKNIAEPFDGIWIKTCPYYRSTYLTGGIACTYSAYYGFEAGLYDQCKICGTKYDL